MYFNGRMLWAASSWHFLDLLCSGEITIPSDSAYDGGAYLDFKDVTVDCLHCSQMHLKASTTHPFRVGIDIFVGKTDNELCLVTTLFSYMVVWGDGKPLSRTRSVPEVKHASTVAGIDSTAYLGHSFRSGAAMTATKQDISNATIRLFIKTPRHQLAAYSRSLVTALK